MRADRFDSSDVVPWRPDSPMDSEWGCSAMIPADGAAEHAVIGGRATLAGFIYISLAATRFPVPSLYKGREKAR